jgi:hypothetical protein
MRGPPRASPDAAAQLVGPDAQRRQSLIAQRWKRGPVQTGTFRFTFYRPNYILPVVLRTSTIARNPTQPAPSFRTLDRWKHSSSA